MAIVVHVDLLFDRPGSFIERRDGDGSRYRLMAGATRVMVPGKMKEYDNLNAELGCEVGQLVVVLLVCFLFFLILARGFFI